MKHPRISIITPTLNVEAVIERAILSVAGQLYQEIEHLIIDGGSKDNTIAIVQKYQTEHKHIRLIQEKDTGIYDAMNKGIDLSEGDWLYFLGADDKLFDDNVLSDLYSSGMFNQDRVFYGNVFIQGGNPWAKDKTIYDGSFDLNKLLQKNICQQSIFYPRHIVKKNGYFNKEYEITADWDYNLRCFAKHDFLYIDKTIAIFTSGGKSSQIQTDISFKEFSRNIISYFNLDVDDPKHNKPNSPFHNLISYYKQILKVRLNPFTENISEGISLFTAVKDKGQSFEEALKTWVAHEEIDEIIIVDWSSSKSLLPIINKYQNGKIVLVTVLNQEKWVLSHAFNLAARLTTKNKILKIDGDVKILSGFFKKHLLKPRSFFAGDWKKARNENETHLNGNIFLYRDEFFGVNGYNEFFKTYGWDDTDLFSRLIASGLERNCFDFDTLQHIEHKGRMAFQSPSKRINNLSDEEWSRINIFINRFIAKKIDSWSYENEMLNFKFNIIDNHTISCEQVGDDINLLPVELLYQGEIVAIKERLIELGMELPENIVNRISDDEYIAYYNLYLLKDDSESASQLLTLFSRFINIYIANGKQKDKEIRELDTSISRKDQTIREKENNIQTLNQVVEKKEQKIRTITGFAIEKDQILLKRDQEIQEMRQLVGTCEQSIKQKDQEIKNYSEVIGEKDLIIQLKDQELEKKEQLIQTKEQSIQQKNQEIKNKIKVINERDQIILKKDKEIEEMRELIKINEQIIEQKNQEIKNNTEVIRNKEQIILRKDQELHHEEQLIISKDQTIEEKNKLVLELTRQLTDIHQTNYWKFGSFVNSNISKLPFIGESKDTNSNQS